MLTTLRELFNTFNRIKNKYFAKLLYLYAQKHSVEFTKQFQTDYLLIPTQVLYILYILTTKSH